MSCANDCHEEIEERFVTAVPKWKRTFLVDGCASIPLGSKVMIISHYLHGTITIFRGNQWPDKCNITIVLLKRFQEHVLFAGLDKTEAAAAASHRA